ncbi:hypothetical protein B0H10DRAFT_1965628 [Mycena sp. CBHHK59/15]|nr:hypothetical protein B0H10DRAFT_1965628 [Mycena sp. CBHHK59/15]
MFGWEHQSNIVSNWAGPQSWYKIMFNVFNDHRSLCDKYDACQCGPDGFPLFFHANAWDPNPLLDPVSDDAMSMLFITDGAGVLALLDNQLQEIYQKHCIIIEDNTLGPPPPFSLETMERYRDPDDLCDVQDVGLQTPTNVNCARIVQLIFATHEHAMTQVEGASGITDVTLPSDRLRLCLFSSAGAYTHDHVNTAGTIFDCVTGRKIFAIVVPSNKQESCGHFGFRHTFTDWEGHHSNVKHLRWEFFVLHPGQIFYMCLGMLHYVISMDDSVAHGWHNHTCSTTAVAVWNGATTNADHASVQWMFLHIMRFFVKNVCAGQYRKLHVPDITTGKGLSDVVALHCLIVLYPALDTSTYHPQNPAQHWPEQLAEIVST